MCVVLYQDSALYEDSAEGNSVKLGQIACLPRQSDLSGFEALVSIPTGWEAPHLLSWTVFTMDAVSLAGEESWAPVKFTSQVSRVGSTVYRCVGDLANPVIPGVLDRSW